VDGGRSGRGWVCDGGWAGGHLGFTVNPLPDARWYKQPANKRRQALAGGAPVRLWGAMSQPSGVAFAIVDNGHSAVPTRARGRRLGPSGWSAPRLRTSSHLPCGHATIRVALPVPVEGLQGTDPEAATATRGVHGGGWLWGRRPNIGAPGFGPRR